MNTRIQLENIAIIIAKTMMLFRDRSKWLRFKYSRVDFFHQDSYCILGAIGKFSTNSDCNAANRYLTDALNAYVTEKKLTIDTGKYPLNLATFNDGVPYELMMAFIKNTYDKLMYNLDHNLVC
jgi:hypothetical protein